MKKNLAISIFANMFLLAGIVGVWLLRQPVASRPALSSVSTNSQAAPVSVTQKAVEPASLPFHWSQLDAPDYHLYVKNLRAVGCPEATLRAIVTADVHAAFDVRARMLKDKLARLDARPWSPSSGSLDLDTKLKSELEDLPDEEAAEIADLLGFKPKPLAIASTAPADAGADNDPSQDGTPPAVPLLFLNVDPVALGLNDDQQAAIQQLREDFMKRIGGPNQDPNDPAYLARWQQAQPYADGMLQTILGGDTYARYQVLQTQQSLAQNQGNSP